MTRNIVEIEGVSKFFGSFAALTNVDLTIGEGEIVTLLGPSGCGKSTLMRLVAGFEDPTEGEVKIAGKVANGTPPEKRPVNMVFQRYALFPHLNVFENVAFGLRVKGLGKADIADRVNRMIQIVQLEALRDRFIDELSGGQCQRVALARALVNEPQVLLLDEPLAALDLKIRQHMLVELKRIHEATGAAFLYVTHDQDEALILSDRIALVEKGRIVQIDEPHQMYRRPRTLFAAKFLGETNLVEGRIEAVGESRVTVATRNGLKIESAADDDFQTDEKVTLSIRPEAVRFVAADDTAACKARAVVVSEAYMGSRAFVEVDLGGLSFRVQLLGTSRLPRAGERVGLTWNPEDLVVLKR
ncbi:MAG: ABC transporter ATP-binding protein [Rhizobiaceae bacterium]